ncbi:hypothetical protein G6M84_10270 [Agrobacterium tumefaciens]|uniref:hypothetical protein n=1 Tax=Agrobacterium tumefaciens TaxID=358 RepID=UPI0015745882|nr:hypothetical protein [Agrobacterium tumefaciens]NTB96901.1 hypothetical protein [Agrobacterium tumefaciens]NTC44185.1 hypothetical protein [Agrobacterium tumefaciens]
MMAVAFFVVGLLACLCAGVRFNECRLDLVSGSICFAVGALGASMMYLAMMAG